MEDNICQDEISKVSKNTSVNTVGCSLCVVNAAEQECIDCACPLNERTFCVNCSVIHPTKDESLGHVLVSLQRNTGHRNKRCEHGREKRDCVSCGGSRVCEHQRLKRSCRDCGGELTLIVCVFLYNVNYFQNYLFVHLLILICIFRF